MKNATDADIARVENIQAFGDPKQNLRFLVPSTPCRTVGMLPCASLKWRSPHKVMRTPSVRAIEVLRERQVLLDAHGFCKLRPTRCTILADHNRRDKHLKRH